MQKSSSDRFRVGRVLNRRTITAFVLLILTAGLFYLKEDVGRKIREREEARRAHGEQQTLRIAAIQESSRGISKKIQEAQAPEDWRKLLEKDLPGVSREEQKVFGPRIRLKTFEADFWKAERLLARARSFLSSDKNHPVAKRYLAEVDELYKSNQESVNSLADGVEDPLMRARAHYLAGVYYYRSLGLWSLLGKMDEFKGADIVEQAITQLDKALELKKLDRDTQVTIEILQKNAKQFLAAGGTAGSDAGDTRLRLLPQGEVSVPGGGPLERQGGRH